MTTDHTLRFHHLQPENAALLEDADIFDNPVDSEQLAAFVADSGHKMIFATLGEQVVGMASGTVLLHPDKHPAFFINEVEVAEDMRCQGIGTRLVEMLMREARDSGCQGIWLATETDNIEARALYQKLGGRLTESVVVYDWDGAMDDEA